MATWKEVQSLCSFLIINFARSLRRRVASFYDECNGIFGNNGKDLVVLILINGINKDLYTNKLNYMKFINRKTKIPPYDPSRLLKVS